MAGVFDGTTRSRLAAALRLACDAARVGAEVYDPDGNLQLDCNRIGIDTPEVWAAAETDEALYDMAAVAREQQVARAIEWNQPHLFDVVPGISEAVVPLFCSAKYVGYVRVGPVRTVKDSHRETDGEVDHSPVSGVDSLPRMTIRQFLAFLDLLAAAVQPCLSAVQPPAKQEQASVELPVRPRTSRQVLPPAAAQLAKDLFVMARYGRVSSAVRMYRRERLDGKTMSEDVRSRILSDILALAECCANVGVSSPEIAEWTNAASSRATAAETAADVEQTVAEFLSCIRRSGRRASRIHAERLRRVARYVETHVGEPLSVGNVAVALGMKSRRIADTVKTQTGMSYRSFIAVARISRARNLLENTGLSVATVARRVGYRYESHFSRVFTQHVGDPPTRYRERATVNSA
jgi:AraC-like DNA-binding protein